MNQRWQLLCEVGVAPYQRKRWVLSARGWGKSLLLLPFDFLLGYWLLATDYLSTTTTSLTFLVRQDSTAKCHDIVNKLVKGGFRL